MVKHLLKRILPRKILKMIKLYKSDNYYILSKYDLNYAQDMLYTLNNADFMKDAKFI